MKNWFKELQENSIERQFLVGFILLTLVTATTLAASFLSMNAALESERSIDASYEFMVQLRTTLASLERAENGGRGYLLTGDPETLAPYTVAISTMERRLSRLRQATAGDVEKLANVQDLENDINRRLQHLKQSIEMRVELLKNPQKMRERILDSLFVLERVRSHVEAMEQQESARLRRSLEAAYQAVDRAHIIFLVLTMLVLILLASLVYNAHRHIKAGQELREVEEQLSSHERLFMSIIDTMTEGVSVIDTAYNFVLMNPAAKKLMHVADVPKDPWQWPEKLGIFLSDGTTPFPVDELPGIKALRGMDVEDTELFLRNENIPEGVYLSVNARPLKDSTGKIIGSFSVSRDITGRKRMEEALQRARDEAIEATQLKSQFVANISHEIRTPMSGLLGMSELLVQNTFDHESRELAQYIHDSAKNLLHVVNDLLDFSKLEAGRIQLDFAEMSLSTIFDDITRSIAPEAAERNLEVYTHLDPELPEPLCGDAGRLRQVLLNLAHNAVKFTENGRIAIKAEVYRRHQDICVVRFEVKDTGIGIPEELQQRLFQPFVQADGSTTRKYGGTGLGLSICKALVELMGGQIGVVSQSEKGSAFWFNVPLKTAASAREGEGEKAESVVSARQGLDRPEATGG